MLLDHLPLLLLNVPDRKLAKSYCRMSMIAQGIILSMNKQCTGAPTGTYV